MMSAVRVELMASAVGKIGGVTWHHLYLVAIDASGAQSYLRAAPQCLPLQHISGRQTEYGDAMEDYEPSPARPYGVITFSTGAYEPGSVDYDPVAGNTTIASGGAAARLWEALQKAAQELQNEALPYDPIGRGANWATMEILRRCGVEAALPPRRWAPGASRIAPALQSEAVTRRVGQATII